MREGEGCDRDHSLLFRLSMMNLSGLFDTLQLFLTEYNYVSSLMYNPCYKHNEYCNFRNRSERWEASTSGGGVIFALLGEV